MSKERMVAVIGAGKSGTAEFQRLCLRLWPGQDYAHPSTENLDQIERILGKEER